MRVCVCGCGVSIEDRDPQARRTLACQDAYRRDAKNRRQRQRQAERAGANAMGRHHVKNFPAGDIAERIPERKCRICASQSWRVQGARCVCGLTYSPEVIERHPVLSSNAGTAQRHGSLYGHHGTMSHKKRERKAS